MTKKLLPHVDPEVAAASRKARNDRYVTVYFGPEDLVILAALQEKLGCTRSAVIRDALQAYLGAISRLLG